MSRPASEGAFALSLLGLVLSLLFVIVADAAASNPLFVAIGAIVVYAGPQLLHAFANNWENVSSNLNLFINKRVLKKLLSLYFVLILFAIIMHFWDFYDQLRFAPTRISYIFFLPTSLLVAIPYFCTVDRMQADKNDEYAHMGNLLIGRWSEVDAAQVRHFWLGWFIKLFFFPIMFWELTWAIDTIDVRAVASINYGLFSRIILIADVVIAAAGYLFTLRIFGWQIRSVNPFLIGWFVTLLCYYPFFGYAQRLGLTYEDGLTWNEWLADQPMLLALWGAVIVFLKLCWIYSIAPFGLRFSNLTNRGIITNGAFRWTKHPSYISKNVFWWLIYVPFVTTGPWYEALQNCAVLFLINVIYYLRARYEERHLAEDPRYLAYAAWIKDNGLFAILRRFAWRLSASRV